MLTELLQKYHHQHLVMTDVCILRNWESFQLAVHNVKQVGKLKHSLASILNGLHFGEQIQTIA